MNNLELLQRLLDIPAEDASPLLLAQTGAPIADLYEKEDFIRLVADWFGTLGLTPAFILKNGEVLRETLSYGFLIGRLYERYRRD